MYNLKSTRNIFKIVAILFVVPIIMWVFSISKTFKLNNRINEIKKELLIIRERNQFEEPVSQDKSGNGVMLSNGEIVSYISSNLNRHVKIVSYVPNLYFKNETECLYTAQLVISGSFIELLSVVYCLEDMYHPIEIISIEFNIKEGYNIERSLNLTLFLAQVEYL